MATYTLFSQAAPSGQALDSNTSLFTLTTQFSASGPCTLRAVWFYSGSGAVSLPTWAGLFLDGTQAIVAQNASPSWSGAAGSGWVRCPVSGSYAVAASTAYRAGVFGGGTAWQSFTSGYWGASGPGASGITSGILSAPSDAGSDLHQCGLRGGSGSPLYPDGGFQASNYWLDVEVSTSAAAPSPGLAWAAII